MSKQIIYNQPQISIEEQIQLLKSEGLSFQDEKRALHLLRNISMFRMKSYLKPLRQPDSRRFKPCSTFEEAYNIYKFYSELRKMVCSELEKIEVSIRTQLSLIMGDAADKWISAGQARRKVAKFYGLSDTVLESWLHSIVYVRNICAHHSRLWNRRLSINAMVPRRTGLPFIDIPSDTKRVYYALSIILYFLQTVNPNNTLAGRFKTLLTKYPHIDIVAMGFPAGWENDSLWT